jgi:hypothetical protein
MKSLRWMLITFLCLFMLSCAKGETYSLYLRYQPLRELSSLQQKIGSTLGMVSFRDERPDTLYIGHYTPLQGVSTYFKSSTSPLEKAMAESLSKVFSHRGVKIIPVSNWEGKPESLQNMEVDSVLMIEIKKFWMEAKARLFRTELKSMIHLVIHLGVKKEGMVFTRNVEAEKEMTFPRLTPKRMEQTINEILSDIFDNFFSNPY